MVATPPNTSQPKVDKNHHITTSNICINAYRGHDTGLENISITGVWGIRHTGHSGHGTLCYGTACMTSNSIGVAWFDGVCMVWYGTQCMSWLGLLNANKVDVTPGNHIVTPLVRSRNVVIMSDGVQQGTEAVDHFSGFQWEGSWYRFTADDTTVDLHLI